MNLNNTIGILETERLRIVPLTLEQFYLLLHGLNQLEREMGWDFSGELLDTHTQQAMEMLYGEALSHPENYYWYTNWQIVLKSQNIAIGSACFMGEPSCDGIVEVGYGINESFRNKGYMTEAIGFICQWAFNQENVQTVVAETDYDNYSSQRVLEKIGMKKYQSVGNSLWFKINK